MELSENSKLAVLTMQEEWENSRIPLDKEMSCKLIITLLRHIFVKWVSFKQAKKVTEINFLLLHIKRRCKAR